MGYFYTIRRWLGGFVNTLQVTTSERFPTTRWFKTKNHRISPVEFSLVSTVKRTPVRKLHDGPRFLQPSTRLLIRTAIVLDCHARCGGLAKGDLKRTIQSPRDTLQRLHCGVSAPSLKKTQGLLGHPRTARWLFLREPGTQTRRAHAPPQPARSGKRVAYLTQEEAILGASAPVAHQQRRGVIFLQPMHSEYLTYVPPAHRSNALLAPRLNQAWGHLTLAALHRKRKHRGNVPRTSPLGHFKGELPRSLVKTQDATRHRARMLL